MTRALPDGSTLSWRLAVAPEPVGDGLVPFLIDWGSSAHPASTAPGGLKLASLAGEHPEPDTIRTLLSALGVSLALPVAVAPALVAELETPRGRVLLR